MAASLLHDSIRIEQPFRLEDCLREILERTSSLSSITIHEPESVSVVYLAGGKISLVDCDDHDWLVQWKWHAHQVRKTDKWYARRSAKIDGKHHNVTMHRAILERHGFDLTGLDVDHLNGDGLDNRLNNLRPVTKAENAYNRRKSPGHTSKYKGVYFDSERSKWRASIKVNGQTIQLGRYFTEEDAASAYNEAARWYFGGFARLNELSQIQIGLERECIRFRPLNMNIRAEAT